MVSTSVLRNRCVGGFPEALRLVGYLNDEAAGEDSSSTTDALGAIHPGSTVLSKADWHDALLYLQAAVAHMGNWKQTTTFKSRAFYSYAASLFQELKCMHSAACKKKTDC